MKKYFIYPGIALIAALSFSNCKKAELDSNDASLAKAVPFEIVVNTDATKTTNDGLNTKWAAGDAINVFHAETGTTSYGSNDQFTVTGAGETSFSGTLQDGALDNTKSYDWYAFYPYGSYIGTPKNTSSGYLNIGSSNSSTAQKQTGNNSKAHLAGKYFPLYGKVTGVAAGITPSITMKQALAVIKVEVTNNSGAPLTVANVKFTAPESITGRYYIDFSGDTPVFTPSGDSYVSNVASLNVTNGASIEAGGKADFYIAVKPFTAAAGATLKIAVNGYEKSITVPAGGVTFPSGIIKTVNFNFNKTSVKLAAGNYAILAKRSSGNYLYMTTDLGTAATKRFQAEDSGLSELPAEMTVSADKLWTVAVSDDEYTISTKDGKQISWTSGNSAALADSGKKLTIPASVNSVFKVSFAATQTETRTLALNSSSSDNYFAFYTGSGVKDLYFIPATLSTTPTLTLEKTSITDVPAAGVTDETEEDVYTLVNAVDNDVTVTKDGTVVTAVSISGGVLTYTVAANSGAARDGWVELKLEDQEAQKITISQKGANAGEETVLDFTTKAFGNGSYSGDWSYGDWKIVNGANNNKGWGYVKMGGKSATLSSANPCYIYNTVAISHSVKKITVVLPDGSLSKSGMSVNSWGVYVYSDSAMTTQIDYVAGGTITKNAGSFDFTPSEGKTWAKDYYYKVSWDLANTSSTNGIVCVEKITLKEKAE